jgi:hypothetical protein
MKKYLIMFITGALLLTAFLGTVSGANEVMKTDPTGDVFNSGTVGDEIDNVDIMQIRVTYDSFPAMAYLRVAGDIVTDGPQTMSYSYIFLIDSTGDGEADIDVTCSFPTNVATIMWGEDGMGVLDQSKYSVQNGDTLVFELAQQYFSSEMVYDISAASSATDLRDTSNAVDSVDFDAVSDDDDIDDDATDDDIDDDIDDDLDDDIDDDDDGSSIPDPKTETPTDNSVSVEITDVSFEYDVTEEHMTIEIKMSGTTSGNVDHCSNIMVTYDENGNPEGLDENEWEEGPDGIDRMTFMGYTMEQHFWGTGAGGQSDWSTWEFYVYMDGPFDENMSMVDEEELEEGKSAVFYVRAFSDEAETMWNQDSKDVTEEIIGAVTGDDDDSPMGAAVILLGFIAAAGVITVFSRRRK